MSEQAELLRIAFAAHNSGLCVLPPREDGTKAPDSESWRRYQQGASSREELLSWYDVGSRSGIGIVLGQVSGNVEGLDFDTHDAYRDFYDVAHASGLGSVVDRIQAGYYETTPNGAHYLYRVEPGSSRSRKLAQTRDRQTLIETKGEGGYLVIAPTSGPVNPSGSYELVSGGFDSIAMLTGDEHAQVLALARAFDRSPTRESTAGAQPSGPRMSGDVRPGDDFNDRETWGEVLEPHGWMLVYEREGVAYWRRPGKPLGVSATTNHGGNDRLKVFSTSTEFEAVGEVGRTYDKFGAHAVLNHSGDLTDAARELGSRGYGRAYNDAEGDMGEGRSKEPSGVEEEWGNPIPLTDTGTLPEFPLKVLPGYLRSFVEGVAIEVQVPADLPGMLVLSAVSCAIAKKVEVSVASGWTEPVNIWTATSLDVADRKSSVVRAVIEPLVGHDSKQRKSLGAAIATAEARLEHKRAELASKRRKVGQQQENDGRLWDETERLTREVAEAETEIPIVPRLFTDDATPEALATLMDRHGGRMGLFSAEGSTLFDIAAGRYSANQRPNMGVYLAGHAGDDVRVDRQTKAALTIDKAALSIGVAIQPAALRRAGGLSAFRELGMLARFLYARPRSLVGVREINPLGMLEEVRSKYAEEVERLLDWPLPAAPVRLTLSTDAKDLLDDFRRQIEPELGEFGELEEIRDWAGKLAGAAVRVAAGLHCAIHETARRAEDVPGKIELAQMKAAITLARDYLMPHAHAFFGDVGIPPEELAAAKIFRSACKWSSDNDGLLVIERQTLYQRVKRGCIRRIEDFDAGLQVLVGNNFVRILETPKTGRRGRPSGAPIALNPGAVKAPTEF